MSFPRTASASYQLWRIRTSARCSRAHGAPDALTCRARTSAHHPPSFWEELTSGGWNAGPPRPLCFRTSPRPPWSARGALLPRLLAVFLPFAQQGHTHSGTESANPSSSARVHRGGGCASSRTPSRTRPSMWGETCSALRNPTLRLPGLPSRRAAADDPAPPPPPHGRHGPQCAAEWGESGHGLLQARRPNRDNDGWL